MRKSECVQLLARRLGLRRTRLTSLTQRLAEAGMLPVSSGPPYPDLAPVEVARMLIVGMVDEGIAAAPSVVAKYGELVGPNSTMLEGALAHALARPDSLAPICSGMEIHTGDAPHVLLTVVTGDGAATRVYGDLPFEENVDRLITVPGSALFAISQEISGISAVEVDRMLKGMK